MFKFFNIYYNYYCNEEGVIISGKTVDVIAQGPDKIFSKMCIIGVGEKG